MAKYEGPPDHSTTQPRQSDRNQLKDKWSCVPRRPHVCPCRNSTSFGPRDETLKFLKAFGWILNEASLSKSWMWNHPVFHPRSLMRTMQEIDSNTHFQVPSSYLKMKTVLYFSIFGSQNEQYFSLNSNTIEHHFTMDKATKKYISLPHPS